jgi:hypothetical protein
MHSKEAQKQTKDLEKVLVRTKNEQLQKAIEDKIKQLKSNKPIRK